MRFFPRTVDILSENEVDYIHEHSLKLLEDMGMLIHDEEILNLLKRAHCHVDFSTKNVRVPPQIVEDAIKLAPHEVKLCGRNEKRDIVLDGKSFYARPVGGPPTMVDMETRQRRPATKEDIAVCARLTDALDHMHTGAMFNAVPMIPLVDVYDAMISFNNTEKHLYYIAHNKNLIEPVLEIATAVAKGEKQLRERPLISGLVESLSPLQLEDVNAANLKSFARRGLPIAIHSHPIAGLSSPVTLADELAVLNAEILMMATIIQLFEPGTPVTYGIAASVPDMRTALNLAGSVEVSLLACAGAQMARRYGLRSITTAGTDAHTTDEQAAMERLLTTLVPAMCGIDLINMSGLGCKLTFSAAQLVIDNEMMGVVNRFLRGIAVEKHLPVVELMQGVGFKGTLLGHRHTVDNFREELLESRFLNRSSWADWEKFGSKPLDERAWEIARRIVNEHKPNPLPQDVQKEIDNIISSVERKVK